MATYNLLMIEKLTSNDTEFTRVMVRAFLEEIPGDIRAMNEAIDNENAALAFQVAHKMKPNLEMFGLNLLTEIELIEAWYNHHLSKEEITAPANEITDRVFRAAKELKKDFDL